MTVKSLNEQGQPVGVEIFHYRDDLSLESYILHAVPPLNDKTWILHGVNHKKWLNGKETLETSDNLAWQSAFTSMDLEELSMPGILFLSVSLIITSIICRKPDNPAANTALHCGKTGATDPDPGDDFAGCAVHL